MINVHLNARQIYPLTVRILVDEGVNFCRAS